MPCSLERVIRCLINSAMLSTLEENPDGGITLFMQTESPGQNTEASWLPAPKGPFWTTLQRYWPKPDALDDDWIYRGLRVHDGAAAPAQRGRSELRLPSLSTCRESI